MANDRRIAHFEAAQIPLVTLEHDPGRPEWGWWVGSDNRANTLAVLDHLEEAGARRVGLLSMDVDWGWISDTEAAYGEWCRDRDLEPVVVRTPLALREETVGEAARELLDRRERVDAIFTPPERFALAAIRVAEAGGRVVPRDLLVAAGVDSHAARANRPPITAVDLHPREQADAAVELLLARLAGTAAQAPRVIPGQLRVRGSSAALRRAMRSGLLEVDVDLRARMGKSASGRRLRIGDGPAPASGRTFRQRPGAMPAAGAGRDRASAAFRSAFARRRPEPVVDGLHAGGDPQPRGLL